MKVDHFNLSQVFDKEYASALINKFTRSEVSGKTIQQYNCGCQTRDVKVYDFDELLHYYTKRANEVKSPRWEAGHNKTIDDLLKYKKHMEG